ncbi:MAG: DUF2304 family protein [bacterium]
MIIKILVSLFALFAISRTFLRQKEGSVGFASLILWTILWCGIVFFVWWPRASDVLAGRIGIGRGVDALVYISIVALFYGMFRIYIKLEYIEREITSLVRSLALEEHTSKPPEEPKKMDATQ